MVKGNGNGRKKPAPNSKRTPQLERVIIAGLGRGLTIETSAAIAGVHRNTVNNWIKADPAFCASCAEAAAAPTKMATEVVLKAIEDGDVHAAQWWLERRTKAFRKDAEPETIDHATKETRSVAVGRWTKSGLEAARAEAIARSEADNN